MGTGTKIAIGCGIVVLLAGVVAIVGLGAGAYWLKGKAQQAQQYAGDLAAKAEQINKYETEANRNPFTPPSDGVIPEPRLVKFLGVRKLVSTVYEQHKPEFESFQQRTKDKKDLNLSETLEAGGKIASLVSDIRMVQVKALAEAGMSESEYRFIQQAVYHTAWASEFQKETGMQPGEMMAQSTKAGGMSTGEALRRAQEAARQAGMTLPAQPSEEDLQKTDEAMKQMADQAGSLNVPQANIDLFRKYEADIKKYAMSGLAFLGL